MKKINGCRPLKIAIYYRKRGFNHNQRAGMAALSRALCDIIIIASTLFLKEVYGQLSPHHLA